MLVTTWVSKEAHLPTKLTKNVIRETGIKSNRGRQLIIRLDEGGHMLRFREAGCQLWYSVAMSSVWNLAVRTAAAGDGPRKLTEISIKDDPPENIESQAELPPTDTSL
jgi:hypothetical protein